MIRPLTGLLFGALFTVTTAWALGALVIRKLSLTLYRVEERVLAFALGSACLSAIIFLLCSAKLAHRGVFLAVGLAIIGYTVHSGVHRSMSKPLPQLSRPWRWVFVSIFGAFALFYLTNAMAPEVSPDGLAYHLSFVAKYARAHGFVPITTNIYASLSQGAELLFLFAFEFGRHSAAALVHFTFWIVLALMILCYARRIGRPQAGVAAAIFTCVAPVVALDGSVAYIDVAEAAVVFAVFYLLQIWSLDRNAKLLIPIGILAGFAYAVKYTGGLAVVYAIGFVAWKLWRAKRPVIRHVLVVSGLALVMILPWMVKDWLVVDNPISPFGNRLFPNPYVHISMEQEWRQYLRTYGLASYWELPRQLTLRGDRVNGFFGPLFLLTPLALLAVRFPAGRQLLLAGAIFALPYFSNVGARFLIPVIPFLSLALALVLARAKWLLLLLTVGHAIASMPLVYQFYSGRSTAWAVERVFPKAALRIESEESFLRRESIDYNVVRMLDRLVPPSQPVFAFTPPAESYTSREILISYQAGYNELLQDIVWTPMFSDFSPDRILKFQFPGRTLRKIRIVQTAGVRKVQWSVAEMRIFDSVELARAPEWRLTARPNPWDVQLAFDNSPVTRWRSWQDVEPGMYIEVDFGKSQRVDSVVLESSADALRTNVKLDGMDSDGRWTTLSGRPQVSRAPERVSLRLAAAGELKARGIRYILVDDSNLGADDFRLHGKVWGMTLVGQWTTHRLYYIE
jgi:F5/8 type C domain-containing protein/dolichyl-phosphate-mannose-protein mannosyltransferase